MVSFMPPFTNIPLICYNFYKVFCGGHSLISSQGLISTISIKFLLCLPYWCNRSLPILSFYYFLGRPQRKESIDRDNLVNDEDNDGFFERDEVISKDGLTNPLTLSDVYIDQHQNNDFEEDERSNCIPISHHHSLPSEHRE